MNLKEFLLESDDSKKLQKIKDSNAYLGNGFVTVKILKGDVDEDIYKYISEHSTKSIDVENANMETQSSIPEEDISKDIKDVLYNKFGKLLNKDKYKNFYFVKYDDYISVFIGDPENEDFLKNVRKQVISQQDKIDKGEDELMVEKPKTDKESDSKKESGEDAEDDNEDEMTDEELEDKIKNMSDEELENMITDMDNESRSELIEDLKNELDKESDDEEKEKLQGLIDSIEKLNKQSQTN